MPSHACCERSISSSSPTHSPIFLPKASTAAPTRGEALHERQQVSVAVGQRVQLVEKRRQDDLNMGGRGQNAQHGYTNACVHPGE